MGHRRLPLPAPHRRNRVVPATGDVLAVRDLLGHENLGTTARYVKGMNVEGLRATVDACSYLSPEVAR